MPSSRYTNSWWRTSWKTARTSATRPQATNHHATARRMASARGGREERLGAREVLGPIRVEEGEPVRVHEGQVRTLEPRGLDRGEHVGDREASRGEVRASERK